MHIIFMKKKKKKNYARDGKFKIYGSETCEVVPYIIVAVSGQ